MPDWMHMFFGGIFFATGVVLVGMYIVVAMMTHSGAWGSNWWASLMVPTALHTAIGWTACVSLNECLILIEALL